MSASTSRNTRDVEPTTSTASQSKISNEPANFTSGAKIATLCTVCLTIGLAIPLAMTRRKSVISPSAASHPLSRPASGVSPTLLLRNASRSPGSTTTPSSMPSSSPASLSLSEVLRSSKSSSKSLPKPAPAAQLDAMLFSMKAFGVATAAVVASAGAGILSFRYLTGVSTVNEFTVYMQPRLRAVLPTALASRLEPVDDPNAVIFNSESAPADSQIAEAERRMQEAYDQGGFTKFGHQMWVEFEREWDESRPARERTPVADSGTTTNPTP